MKKHDCIDCKHMYLDKKALLVRCTLPGHKTALKTDCKDFVEGDEWFQD